MIFNYLKTALRNFQRERFFTIINLVGLSFGLSVSLTIFIFIYQQLEYDNFHPDSENTYRLGTHLALGGEEGYLNASHPVLSSTIKEELPQVKYSSRVEKRDGVVFQVNENVFEEDKIMYADQDFFNIFGYDWLYGVMNDALSRPRTVVLTPELAAKYFEKDLSEIVGESIKINKEQYEITGIIDKAPTNSHIKYNAIVTLTDSRRDQDKTWDNINLSTYATVNEGTNGDELTALVQDVFVRSSGYDPSSGLVMEYFSQPLEDINLKSNLDGEFERNADISTLYLFIAIALVILFLAIVNFMNLSTARSMYRAKEVGVRKVLGSSTASLRAQFLFESIVMTSIAMILALAFTELLSLPLSSILGEDFGILNVLGFTEAIVLVLFTIATGLMAGTYPAFFLSSFKPVVVLKGKVGVGAKGRRLRNSLVILQFVISCTLITATLLFNGQIQFLREKSLGFDKENVIEVKNVQVIPNQEVLMTRINNIAGVESSAVSVTGPIGNYDGTQIHTPSEREKVYLINFNRANDSYLSTMKMNFVSGRNFDRNLSGDSVAVVLNKSAADMVFFGDAIGKELMFKGGSKIYKVVGVVEDFNFESLKKTIMPLMFLYNPKGRTMEIRIQPGNYANTISEIETIWKGLAPDTPFNYSFIDEQYDNLYKSETQTGGLITGFTIIAVIIACLGLFGLAAYMTERRNKEIGIRKALGATIPSIVVLLSTDFMKIVGIAFLLSIPLTWYMVDQWLENYAYKIDPNFLVYALGGFIAIILSLATIGFQSVKAATENPIETLKDE